VSSSLEQQIERMWRRVDDQKEALTAVQIQREGDARRLEALEARTERQLAWLGEVQARQDSHHREQMGKLTKLEVGQSEHQATYRTLLRVAAGAIAVGTLIVGAAGLVLIN